MINLNRFKIIASVIIFILTAIVYSNSLHNQFTNWDDDALIVNNLSIRSLSIDNIEKIFHFHFGGGTYQPLRTFSYAIDYHFFKLKPTGYHIHNILLHALAGIFLFLALCLALPQIYMKAPDIKLRSGRRASIILPAESPVSASVSAPSPASVSASSPASVSASSPASVSASSPAPSPASVSVSSHLSAPAPVHSGLSETDACLIAFFSALLFAVHPVNVEAVTWLSSRKYVLLSFFSFLSFYAFVLSLKDERFNILFGLFSLLCVICACLSSPFGVVLPALFLLFICCREASCRPFIIIKKYFLFFVPYAVVGIIILFLLLYNLAGSTGGAAMSSFHHDFIFTFFSMMKGLTEYIQNLLCPLWLNNRYVDYVYLSFWIYYKVPLGLFGLCFVLFISVYKFMHGRKIYFFGVMWFLTAWLPASNIIPISIKMADRYIYIADPGLFVVFVYLMFRFAGLLDSLRAKSRKKADLKTDLKINVNKVSRAEIKKTSGQTNLNYVKLFELEFFKKICIGVLSILLLIYSNLSMKRNLIWLNSGTLWADSIKKDANNNLAHVNLAVYLFKHGEVKKAINHLKMARKVQPNDFKAVKNLAWIMKAMGSMDKALMYYSKVVEMQHKNADALLNLATLFRKKGEIAKALNYADRIDYKQLNSPNMVNDLAELYTKCSRPAKAVLILKYALKTYPENFYLHYAMGRALSALKKFKEAILHYNEAVKLNPEFYDAFNNLGLLYEKQGNYQKAYYCYKKALEGHKKGAEVLNNMGNILLKSGSPEKAVVYYKKAISIDNKFLKAYYNLGCAYSKMGDRRKSIKNFNFVLKLDNDNIYAINNLANMLLKVNSADRSIHFYKRAIELRPDYVDAYYNLATALSARKEYNKALLYIKKALRLSPDDPGLLKMAGMLSVNVGDMKGAMKVFNRIIDMGKGTGEIYYYLGIVDLNMKKTGQAEKNMRTALSLVARGSSLYKKIMRISQKAGLTL